MSQEASLLASCKREDKTFILHFLHLIRIKLKDKDLIR